MPRIRDHGQNCACCVPTAAAQSLEEIEFTRSCCHFASLGDLARVQAIIEKSPQSINGDGKRGTSGYTPLHYASRAGHAPVVTALLAAGANVNAATRASAATPLHRAAFAGHTAVVQLLLDAGAKCEFQDADGQTALHKALQQGHTEVAELLLHRCPALADIKDYRGQKPGES